MHRHFALTLRLPVVRLAAIICVLALALSAGESSFAQAPANREPLVLVTETGEHSFQVEIAATSEEQTRGLMYRRTLGADEGMLFTYEEPQDVSMWMRNTFISLDMIFIKADGRVHRVEERTEPHSERIIESGDRVLAVLEVQGGTSAKIGLKPGDAVRHRIFKPSGD